MGILSLTKTLVHMSSSHKNQLIFDIQRFYTFTMVRELIHAGDDHRITECIGLGGSLGIILSNCLCQATSCNVLQDLLRGHKLILSFFSFMVGFSFSVYSVSALDLSLTSSLFKNYFVYNAKNQTCSFRLYHFPLAPTSRKASVCKNPQFPLSSDSRG